MSPFVQGAIVLAAGAVAILAILALDVRRKRREEEWAAIVARQKRDQALLSFVDAQLRRSSEQIEANRVQPLPSRERHLRAVR